MTLSRYLMALLLCTSAASADTITIRADNWFPMNGEPDSNQPGYMIELAKTIFTKHGHSVDYRTMPWKRALKDTGEGKINCVVGAYKEDAPDFVFPEESWGMDQTFFFTAKDSDWRFTSVSQLREEKVKIAAIGAYAYSEEFDAFAKEYPAKMDYVNADNALENNIKKVLAGRVTATVESKPVMRAKAKEMNVLDQLRDAGQLSEPTEMYIACSPAVPESQTYVKLIDAGTRELRASGKLAEILGRYGLEDWK